MKADSEALDEFEGEGSKGNNVICVRYADKDYYRNGNILNKFEQ